MDVDITSKNEVRKLASDVKKRFGRIDGLINNAFLNHAKNQAKNRNNSFETFPIKIWNAALELNLTAVFLCCQEFGKIMAPQKKGVIVNISSIYGMSGVDQRIYSTSKLNSPVSYAASKGGIINLTRYLAAYDTGELDLLVLYILWSTPDIPYMDEIFTITPFFWGAIIFPNS
jgi:NAD(P)-dependent dehydrogenase (short-subunit alcohol dehydrogenase family)